MNLRRITTVLRVCMYGDIEPFGMIAHIIKFTRSVIVQRLSGTAMCTPPPSESRGEFIQIISVSEIFETLERLS